MELNNPIEIESNDNNLTTLQITEVFEDGKKLHNEICLVIQPDLPEEDTVLNLTTTQAIKLAETLLSMAHQIMEEDK